MATAPQHADRTASEARRPGSSNPGRRRQRYGRLANASPVRDERIANLEQRDPRSGDAQGFPTYYSGSMRQLESHPLQQTGTNSTIHAAISRISHQSIRYSIEPLH